MEPKKYKVYHVTLKYEKGKYAGYHNEGKIPHKRFKEVSIHEQEAELLNSQTRQTKVAYELVEETKPKAQPKKTTKPKAE